MPGGGVTAFIGLEGSDGWPALKSLLSDAWIAKISEEVGQQKSADPGVPSIPGGKKNFPAPKWIHAEGTNIWIADL